MLSVALETGAMASGPDGWSGALEEKDGHHLSRRPPAPQPHRVSSILKGLVVCPYRIDTYSWYGLAFPICKAIAKTNAGAYRMPDP